MADQWYYGRKGQQLGPITEAQLRQLAASGQLLQTDSVWKKGMAQWVKADQIKGLFPPAPQAPESTPDAPPPLPPGSDSPPASPPNEQESGLDVESLTAAPSTSSAGSSASLQKKGKALLGSLASRGKAAGLLIAKQTERTKLLNVTLPHHYHCLGKHLFGSRQYADEFATLHQNIDALLGQIKTLETRSANEPKAEGIAAKAKAAAKAAQDAVQAKTLKMKLGHALAELGKAAFEKHGEESGPEDLIRPIANAKSRAEQLATEMAQLSKAPAGQVLTPKRIAIGAFAVACLLLLLVGKSMFFGRSGGGYQDIMQEYKAKDAAEDAKRVQEFKEGVQRALAQFDANKEMAADTLYEASKGCRSYSHDLDEVMRQLSMDQQQKLFQLKKMIGPRVARDKAKEEAEDDAMVQESERKRGQGEDRENGQASGNSSGGISAKGGGIHGEARVNKDGSYSGSYQGDGFSARSKMNKDGSGEGEYEVNGKKMHVKANAGGGGSVEVDGREYQVPKP